MFSFLKKKQNNEIKVITIYIRLEHKEKPKVYSLDIECVGAESVAIDSYKAIITNYLLEKFNGKMYCIKSFLDTKPLFMVFDSDSKEIPNKPYLVHKNRTLGKYPQRTLPNEIQNFRDFIHGLLIRAGEDFENRTHC